ncbi:hypothetical protein ABK040_002073 [Willaertia magna]
MDIFLKWLQKLIRYIFILLYLIIGKEIFPTNAEDSLAKLIKITGYMKSDIRDFDEDRLEKAIELITEKDKIKVWNDTEEDYQLYLKFVKNNLKEMFLTEKEMDEFHEMAFDLIAKLIHFNPSKRITIEEALKHDFLKLYSNNDMRDRFFENYYNEFDLNNIFDNKIILSFEIALQYLEKFKKLKKERKEIKKIFTKCENYFKLTLQYNNHYQDLLFTCNKP